MIHFFGKKINIKVTKGAIVGWLKIMLFLLDDAAALLIVILLLWFLKIQIPLSIIITIAVLVGSLVFIIHKAVIPDFRKRPAAGPEGMIGVQGRR